MLRILLIIFLLASCSTQVQQEGISDKNSQEKIIINQADELFSLSEYSSAAEKYKEAITEVRIEGHTSSQWSNASDETAAYFFNMALSQARTRSTLEFLYGLEKIEKDKYWIRERFTANGLSSSKIIFTAKGEEDVEKSRRVEFRLITDAESQLLKLLEKIR